MTTTTNVSTQRATLAAMLTALLAGIASELPGVDPFVVDGQTIARADLIARIQAALDAIAAVKAARTALQAAVATQTGAITEARGLRAGVKRVAQSKLGPTSPKLQALGFTPNRARKTSTQTKAQAVAKANATKAAETAALEKATAAAPETAPAVPAAPAAPKS